MGKISKRAIVKHIEVRSIKYNDTELCQRFQKGDLPAFTELTGIYKRLVDTVAARYDYRQLPKSELAVYAKIGLLKAAHRYDESKMVSFRLYAIWWMRQVIMKALHEQARIEQIPEILIQSMYEIMESFKQNNTILNQEIKHLEIVNAVEGKISEIKKLRISKSTSKHS